jgi:peptidoglycan/LPS O-acetylase OafA/YrhL
VLSDGIPRALFSFFAGVLVNRIAPHRSYAGSSIVFLALLTILALNFGKQLQLIYELLVILIVFPTLLFFASLTSANGRQSKIYEFLGAISYPMYVIHMPVVLWVSAIFPRVVGRGLVTIAPWGGIALITLIALVSLFLDRAYDEPLRHWLRQRMIRRIKLAT